METWFDATAIPTGYRFLPTDEELITYYLRRKTLDQVLPINRFKEVDLYKFTPEELEVEYGARIEKEMYFFTKTTPRHANGSRPNRTARGGFWRASTSKISIKDDRGCEIGSKRLLVYHTNSEKKRDSKSDWIMYEYTLPSDSKKIDGYVLCKVYNKSKTTQNLQTIAQLKEPCQNMEEVTSVCLENQNSQPDVYQDLNLQPTNEICFTLEKLLGTNMTMTKSVVDCQPVHTAPQPLERKEEPAHHLLPSDAFVLDYPNVLSADLQNQCTELPSPAEVHQESWCPNVSIADQCTELPSPAEVHQESLCPNVSIADQCTELPSPAEVYQESWCPNVSIADQCMELPSPAEDYLEWWSPNVLTADLQNQCMELPSQSEDYQQWWFASFPW